MRHQKPIPKESSFKEYSENQAKNPRRTSSQGNRKPGVSAKIKKMFNDRSDKRSEGRKSDSGRNDRRKSDSRDSGARTKFSDRKSSQNSGDRRQMSDSRGSRDSGRNDSRSKFSDRGNSYSKGADSKGSRGRDSGRNDRRKSDSKRPSGKHDRRTSRGKSFKEDRRASKDANREMFDAVCMKCGKKCKVPFKPTKGKGVSCSECFEAKARNNDSQYGVKTRDQRLEGRKRWSDIAPSMRGAERRAREGIKQRGFTKNKDNGQRFAQTKSGRKELFDAVCMKCGNKCKVPFKPTGKMGVSCTNCYDKSKSPFKSGKKKKGAKTFAQKITDSNKKKFGKKRY